MSREVQVFVRGESGVRFWGSDVVDVENGGLGLRLKLANGWEYFFPAANLVEVRLGPEEGPDNG